MQKCICTQEERIRKIETDNRMLNDKLDSLIKKIDRWANVTIGLIVTVVGTVVGGVMLAFVLYLLNLK